MKRLVFIATVSLILAACAGSAQTRLITTVGIACDTYSVALKELAVLRRAGRLNQDIVAEVDQINREVDPICLPGSTVDPAIGLRTVNGATARLNAIKESN